MPDGGRAEAALTADYNAEMLEHRARFPRSRDRSIFVGNPADVVAERFGPGLPSIRDWTEQNFEFSGYVTGASPPVGARTHGAATRLGLRSGPATVRRHGRWHGGGRVASASGARRGADRAAAAPELHFLVVTGPRIDPASLPRRSGVRVRGFVPDLDQYLAACDVAVVQGGLSTCMELTAAGTPFIYVPLRASLRAEHPRAASAWTATAPDGRCVTPTPRPRPAGRRHRREWAPDDASGRSRPMGRRGPPRCSPSWYERPVTTVDSALTA